MRARKGIRIPSSLPSNMERSPFSLFLIHILQEKEIPHPLLVWNGEFCFSLFDIQIQFLEEILVPEPGILSFLLPRLFSLIQNSLRDNCYLVYLELLRCSFGSVDEHSLLVRRVGVQIPDLPISFFFIDLLSIMSRIIIN